ncbi:MAG TPA: proteobacterial dedicated sortase system histidine kinase, partial [Burkholderiales bacterium]|nr:proteobacterial dedicated sortase system histidine kinase [Burkholderiales bacterium]
MPKRFWYAPGIRTKVLLVSCFLLTIPWLGYEYVWEMEKFLRQGQEKTLVGTARAVATALHDRPKLFELQPSYLVSLKDDNSLYVHSLRSPIQLDGRVEDWFQSPNAPQMFAGEHLLHNTGFYSPESLSFEHRLGKHGKYVYALFEVVDDHVVFRSPKRIPLDRSDHLEISIANSGSGFTRYYISPTEAGWAHAYYVVQESEETAVIHPETRIKGVWRNTETGYTLEVRIPLGLMGPRIAFAIADVDDPATRAVTALMGTSGTRSTEALQKVFIPSSEIELILKGLGRTTSRIWVVDRQNKVLALAGSLKDEARDVARTQTPQSLWKQAENIVLKPLYAQILRQPSEDFEDELSNAEMLRGSEIDGALGGKLSTHWRLTPDHRAVILSAAHPIWIDDEVMGAVVVEETTNGILTQRNRALERLFNIILAVFLLGTLTLFLFASRLSSRIRKLRNQTERAIDPQGRVRKITEGSKARDEIGDLSRSFSNILERLSQYTSYLESMATRLSHELRTPIAVVRSSLDNLKTQPLPVDAKIYMERADEGLTRLNTILTNMSEATRLEQILQNAEREKFDLREVVAGCVAGYNTAYPEQKISLSLPDSAVMLNGVADLFAQLLDKLASNAMDFAYSGTEIAITLERDFASARLQVSNEGPPLPGKMQGRLFESMVSIRPHKDRREPHLGLGLYIVRL